MQPMQPMQSMQPSAFPATDELSVHLIELPLQSERLLVRWHKVELALMGKYKQ